MTTNSLSPEERAAIVVRDVRDDELFNVPSDERWQRAIAQAIRAALDDWQNPAPVRAGILPPLSRY